MVMKSAKDIKLGNKVREDGTGFEGIASQQVTRLNGNVRFVVQPEVKKLKDGTIVYPEAYEIDSNLLSVIGEGIAAKAVPPTETENVELGNQATDIVSGMKGIVIEKSVFINGCISWLLADKVKDGQKLEESMQWFSNIRVKKTGQGIAAKVEPAPITKSGHPPGGPSTRVMRSSR